jgi:hypothetical protein
MNDTKPALGLKVLKASKDVPVRFVESPLATELRELSMQCTVDEPWICIHDGTVESARAVRDSIPRYLLTQFQVRVRAGEVWMSTERPRARSKKSATPVPVSQKLWEDLKPNERTDLFVAAYGQRGRNLERTAKALGISVSTAAEIFKALKNAGIL